MSYFITGATGFIGRHLLQKLLHRKGTIYCLVRKESLGKFKDISERLGAGKDRIIPVVGDMIGGDVRLTLRVEHREAGFEDALAGLPRRHAWAALAPASRAAS